MMWFHGSIRWHLSALLQSGMRWPHVMCITAGLLMVFPVSPAAGTENEMEMHVESGEERLRLVFIWNQPVDVRHEAGGKELLLRFSTPLDPSLLFGLPAQAETWIAWVSAGYDSLLIHARQNVIFQVRTEHDTRVVVELFPRLRAEKPKLALQQSEAVAFRLERLRALWLAETGNLFEARSKLGRLREQYPDNSELLPDMADIAARLGQWQQAVIYYNQALHMGRDEPAVIAAKASLLYEHGPRLRLDMGWQQLRDADWQQISRLAGHEISGEKTRLGFAYEQRSIRDDELRRIDGVADSFSGERNYFEFHAQRYFDWAAYTRLTLSGGNDATGLRAEYSQRLDLDRIWIDAGYRLPAWDYVEGVVDGGTVDYLGAGWERPGRDGWRRPADEALSAWVTASVKNYGVRDDDSVAGSYSITLGARLLLQEMAPRLSVGYKLDLEERTFADTRHHEGVAYHPLPVASRQIHTVDAMWFDRLSDYLRYEAGVGASFDPRNDAGGPFVTANLAYEPWPELEAGLKFVHSAGSYRGEYAVYTRAGGYLLLRF